MKVDEYKKLVEQGCKSLWKNYGILPSVAFAQSALESGWGSSGLATRYNNLFGIKGSYLGNSVNLPTTEFYDGKTPVSIIDGFRAYPDWSTSILDYGNFLNVNSRYRKSIGMRDPYQQISEIWRSGYATDPNYVSKIMSIINANGVLEWDREVLGGSNVNTSNTNTNVSSSKLDTIAREVIRGDYGNGNNRKENLFKAVQNVVNLKMEGRYYRTNESIEYLSTLIIQGKLGNGETRKNNIYNLVQKRVNELV